MHGTFFERKLCAQGYRSIIGVDEVGMGSLAGPVVVCAVVVSPKVYKASRVPAVRDSKLLSKGQRERLIQELKALKGISWVMCWCSAATVDQLNIYQASRVAMRRAVQKLPIRSGKSKVMVLVDGNKLIEGITYPQRAIVKGDQKVWAIAAASILAKVYRDAMMTRYARRYPGYGFEVHKGYGTVLHRARLAKNGPCLIHRASFAPLKGMI